ncbi:MAG: helix-turn-helix domain-containing protein [Acidimicrobiales bacterium]|jgi:AcrR family transcriptional regulator
MAKSGAPSSVVGTGGARSAETRRLLIDAAVATLQSEGYAGASARAIAERAGSNQGLIFYHFGSVANLLLAALDAVSSTRMERYGESVAAVATAGELVETATDIFRSDLDAGYITVLVEMIAGASSTPGLGAEVAARIEPWKGFAREAIEHALRGSPLAAALPAEDVAYAVVALYLGLEMLSHLEGDREPALALFSHAQRLAGLFEVMTVAPADGEGP